MATSAFKSTTKRTPIAKSSAPAATDESSSSSRSSSIHRRSRSLSRFSRPMPVPGDDLSDDAPVPRGRFVNTVRGSGFPDITLDDLAVKFFDSTDRGRSGSRTDDVAPGDRMSVSQRRGRSVSRHSSRVGEGKASGGNSYGGGRVNSENNSRRRRSVSVVRYQISDSESDLDHSQTSANCATLKSFNGRNSQVPLSNKTGASNQRQGLRRSLSQKDLKNQDGYSSHSSILTDDEGRDAHPDVHRTEKTIRAVYAQKKAEHPTADDIDMNSGLYAAMRKELRNAVEEIKMELEKGKRKPNNSGLARNDSLQSKSSDVLQAVSTIRKNYASKLELSEKRKQELLSEILLEEQRGRELNMIVKELLPDPNDSVVERPARTRKKSNDRSRMSKRLTEDAEKYIEDFISNLEDTDISSIDGERSSDTSSSLGGLPKTQNFQSPVMSTKSFPVEMDGVVLPWLQWETSNDASPLSSKKTESMATPQTKFWQAPQDATPVQELSNHSISSRGSWSPGIDGYSSNMSGVAGNKFGHSQISTSATRSQFDLDEYMKRRSEEDFLFERWNQQQRIHSGNLLLCNQMFF
ncbi:hypothetical protein JCGZ_11337 [Jatropha curcas]|uniref:Uncharacterized protein n=1 Tax=Jatropha curcas TaxID=180498 RepID=A0A067K405_JATCU|nr:uncharacterized protein LOC105640235 isoform X1 [Jatropha curcas]KDP30961.1 hypothetical protein JCGZ_11337 [Jatropha curcas]